MKRLFDIFISAVALILLTPVFLIVIFILKFSGEGEILFLQKRVGKNRNIFNVYKFTTMLKNSEKTGSGTLTLKNDPRVLPVGKFLRKSKINELPQFLNILKGDMSIIGPRPLVPEGESNYSEDVSIKIRSIRPGATGIGSLVLRDEESYYAHRQDAHAFYRNIISPYKGDLELWYVKNQSLYLDLKILFLTVLAILVPSFDPLKYFENIPQMPEAMITSRANNLPTENT